MTETIEGYTVVFYKWVRTSEGFRRDTGPAIQINQEEYKKVMDIVS